MGHLQVIGQTQAAHTKGTRLEKITPFHAITRTVYRHP
jgi:hypothetical protein